MYCAAGHRPRGSASYNRTQYAYISSHGGSGTAPMAMVGLLLSLQSPMYLSVLSQSPKETWSRKPGREGRGRQRCQNNESDYHACNKSPPF